MQARTPTIADHAKRPIRAFLLRPEPAAEAEFWNIVYGETPEVSHERAVAVAHELEQCRRRVQDLIDGWRPAALTVE